MYHRIFDIENRLDEAMFLLGGRQTGKSTLLKERFPKAVYIDLLKSDVRNRFKQHPDTKQILVSRDRISRRSGDVDLYYVTDFFKALWAGEII